MAGLFDSAGAGDPRVHACRSLGFADLGKAHEVIVSCIRRGAPTFLQRGLNAHKLEQLGYTADGMRRLGCSDAMLAQIGYRVAPPAAPSQPATASHQPKPGPTNAHAEDGDASNMAIELQKLIEGGARASDLRAKGFSVDRVKKTGLSALEMAHLGYDLGELASACGVGELRRADFGPRELKRFFNGDELRRAGFPAADMRLAGFSIRDLLKFGYPENQVRTAGYSTSDLLREGLTRTTRI